MHNSASIATLDAGKIDEIFSGANQSSLPGAAIAIAIDGKPVYRKGFGLANIELPVALGPSMRMRIGSTTKHFTSLAYLLLCEAGLAGLDDEIGKHLPELNETNRHVTLRQLMSHTSGLRDVFAVTLLFHGAGRPVTDKDMLAYYQTIDDVDFEPGTHWSYNNGGYLLVTAAIERITGEPLEDVFRKRIFEPLGMYDTMLRRWDSDFVPNSATLHMVDANMGYTRDYMGMEISGAGGLVATMDDMLRWLRHMDAPVVGSAATWDAIKTPLRLARGVSTGYGLGLISATYRGMPTLSHGGGVMGGNSQMLKLPSAKLDIAVAVNRADLNAADLALKIVDACVEGFDPGEESGTGAPLDGVFLSSRSGRVAEFSAHGDMQLVAVDGASPLPMSLDPGGAFQLPDFMRFMQRSLVPSDAVVRLIEFGDEDIMEPVETIPDAKLGPNIGVYYAPGLDVQLTISEAAAAPRLRAVGRHGALDYRLEPISDLMWKAASDGMQSFILTFDPDGSALGIMADRLPNVRFVRVP
jgi:D-aminopeptidase